MPKKRTGNGMTKTPHTFDEPVLAAMRHLDVPMTRANVCYWAFLCETHDLQDGELQAELDNLMRKVYNERRRERRQSNKR